MTDLLEALSYAEDTNSDRWEFAISIESLRLAGISETDLRWLVKKGYIDHASEVTVQGDNGRQFRPTGNLTFTDRSCIVLTDDGAANIRSINEPDGFNTAIISTDCCSNVAQEKTSPWWDTGTRILSFDGVTIKRFKWRAANQEIVLCAFEEDGWPLRIDDPLPPQLEQDSKRRLSDTIKCLNRKQENELIRFRGDGTGQGIVWERSRNGVLHS